MIKLNEITRTTTNKNKNQQENCKDFVKRLTNLNR